MEDAIRMMSALAQDTRLAVFRELVRAHDAGGREGGLAAGDLAQRLSVPPATLSFHLKELAHAGLVSSRREGRSIIYDAEVPVVEQLSQYLLEDCCNGKCSQSVVACEAELKMEAPASALELAGDKA